MRRHILPTGPKRAVAAVALATLAITGCSESAAPDSNQITMARVDDPTQWFQAEVNRQLLIELGYQVTAPETVAPNTFYPRLSSGQYDLWADGWFPNHTPYLTIQDVTGGDQDAGITQLDRASDLQIVQGYMVDKATADQLGISSVEDFTNPEVAAAFDDDGDGMADLVGCNEGWGCNLVTEEHLAEFDWGGSVNHVVGDFFAMLDGVVADAQAGESVFFYNFTPNWTSATLVPGEDVVWLQAPTIEGTENTTVEGMQGCTADPCELGFPVNKVVSVANTDFISDHPDVQVLLENVDVPAEAATAQNVEMEEAGDGYSSVDLENAAKAWIEDNRAAADEWLSAARDAG